MKTYLILPLLTFIKYKNGDIQINIGWLTKIITFEFSFKKNKDHVLNEDIPPTKKYFKK
jgi:hypothetical protein